MEPNPKTNFGIRIGYLVLPIALLLGLLGVNQADAQFQDIAMPVIEADREVVYGTHDRPASPSACPASEYGLPDVIERDDFCVYYEEAETSNYAGGVLSVEDAELAADIVQDYWDRYDLELGFLTPKYTDKLVVDIVGVDDCNGGTGSSLNSMYVYTGCYENPESIQKVLGHELFHRVQYSYHGSEVKWFKEGTARAMEDNAFDNIDNWATALTAVSSSFNKQVNTYLNSTNNDITSNAMKYNSALWWKYFTEQYGSTLTEPELGVDAFVALWEAAVSLDDIAALNSALSTLGAGTDFNGAFKQFAVANYTKDLTGLPDDSYNYIDEEQVGNPAIYGPVDMVTGGTLDPGDTAGWTNQHIERYGIKYFQMPVGATCPAVSVSFHRDSADTVDVFYHVITQKGGVFDAHREGTGTDWGQSFLNDGITAVAAIVGGLENFVQVDVNFACVVPELEIKIPNSTAVAYVGPYNDPGLFLAQILVTSGSPTVPVVAGLTYEDFQVNVNGEEAPVDGGGFIQEQYWLVIEAPDQLSNGTYDLEVELEPPGSGIPIASDTSPGSVVYDDDLGDHVIVIDRSYSMNDNNKLVAAQDAASFYVDVTLDGDGLAVVPFKENVVDVFPMESVDSDVRDKAKEFIDLLSPSGSTSIGDGLNEAVNQRAGSPTGNSRCGFTLLSDGMENASLYWADVMTDTIDTGCPVTAIAFGPESDETLMQEIATATGGDYFYNDVFVSSSSLVSAATYGYDDIALELGGYYEYAQGRTEGRERLLAENGVSPTELGVENKHYVMVDETISEAVFSLNWARPNSYLRMKLVDPNGNMVTPIDPVVDDENGHVIYRVSKPDSGEWTILVYILEQTGEGVPYQVVVSGHTKLSLTLFLPDKYGKVFYTGQAVPIYALVSYREPLTGVQVDAYVTAPDGIEGHVQLFDDGEHGDGMVNDGLYAGLYTRVNRWYNPPPPPEEGQQHEKYQSGFRVRVIAETSRFRREALGSFAVLRGIDLDEDSLPDVYEEFYGVDDPKGDPDLDKLVTLDEYELGTHPLNPDTDGGGEGDGSEFEYGQDPLDPSDDNIEPPAFFHASPLNGAVRLIFEFDPVFDNVWLYRRNGTNDEWAVISGTVRTGVYTDTTVKNTSTYYYGIMPMTALIGPDVTSETGAAAELHYGGMMVSDGVTPMEDPFKPEARMLINKGAPVTHDLDVTLSFTRYEEEGFGPETFDDIAWVKISNTPSFKGVPWQPFAEIMPWTLADTPPGEMAYVYARFKDEVGNESVGTEVAMILYDWWHIQLPLVAK
jgi:hypothetical protein